SNGLPTMHYKVHESFFLEIRWSYSDFRLEISHLFVDGDHVIIRYKYYVLTKENQYEEIHIDYFIANEEIKDGKIFRGYQVSQPVTDKDDTKESYNRVKI